jgi:hypothetical protein
MKTVMLLVLGTICGLALAMFPTVAAHLHVVRSAIHGAHGSVGSTRAHTEENFSFTAHAAIDRVAPLFGADKERVWAPKWNPQFIHPSPAADVRGMVFTIAHHHLQAVWVNTEFHLANGRVQYVYVIPEIMLTMITIKLQPDGAQTKVEVEYDRTALTPEADTRLQEMAQQDRTSGPEWEHQINQYLQ